MYEELSLGKVVKGSGGLQSDKHLAIFGLAVLLGGPEGLPSLLMRLAQGHHGLALELPHHTPQVMHSVVQRSLCSNVGITLLVALMEGCGHSEGGA